ncbi:MAG TPA: hypothetical protein VFD73_18035 [Gemmatimonadales bacterium]|nr:hypothetical protein [Gemmatimonadales bacterium]
MVDNPNNPFAGDDRLWVRFEMVPVEDPEKTKEAGRTICVDVPHVEIRTPGDRDNVLYRAMTELDKQRFRKRYEEWMKTQTDEPMEGTPLSEVPIFKRREVEECRYMNIYTLEQLAGMSDTHIKKDRGLFGYREKARSYLDVSLRGKEASKLQAEKEALDNKFQALTAASAEQAALIKQLQAQLLSMAQAAAEKAK